MFRPLEAKLIFLVWICLVIKSITACQINKVYKLDEYDCRCVPTITRSHWNCYSKIPLENRTEVSAIPSTTDATQTGPNLLTNTSENVETTGSSTEPRIRTQRIHSTKLSQGGSLGLQKLSRTPREAFVRKTEYVGKKEEEFTIVYTPSAENGPAYLVITCHRGAIEIPGLLKKLENFNVFDVAVLEFQSCPLPKSVTYAQILEIPEKKIIKFSLNSPKLDSPILPKKPFEDYAHFIREFYLIETKQRQSIALEGFEDGFFESFPNLTLLSLSRNNIVSTKGLELIPNLKELNLSGNSFVNITVDLFRNLTELQWLLLNNCRIKSIDKDAFATLADLRVLELSRNFLTELPHELFNKNINLEHLSINMNSFPDGFPENIFGNLGKLENITCTNCEIGKLEPKTFYGTSRLRKLDLSRNGISTLDKDIFSRSGRLRRLLLSWNNLTDIEGLVLPSQLQILDLKHNVLRSLPADVLHSAPNLLSIDLTNNTIESLEHNTFSRATLLESLNLSMNFLTTFGLALTSHMIKIKELNLSHNRLTSLPEIFTLNIVGLRKFDVSSNKISFVRMQTFRSSELDIDLHNNSLETIDVSYLKSYFNATEPGTERITYIIDGPLKCDCHLLDFYLYYKFHKRPSLGEFSVSPRCRDGESFPEGDFRCLLNETQGCPRGCFCDYTAVDERVRVNCSGLNLTNQNLPPLPRNITELTLSNNLFEKVPDLEEYSLLENIDLSNNRINDISDLHSQPRQSWKKVSLANNSISNLGNIRKENYTLNLTGNRLVCSCDSWEALNNYFKDVDHKDKKEIECDKWVNQTYLRLTDFLDDHSCNPFFQHQKTLTGYVVTLVCSAALLIILLVVVYYKNRRKIIVYMYNYHYNIYLLFWPADEVENDKMYDAFVSFCDADLSIVNEMVNELEKSDPVTGEKIYKTCLHHRDWIAGNSITYNINYSVQNSCRTILVLSENFLKSVWLNTELKTALTHSLSDKSHKLIVIVIGELPPENKLDVELRGLLENTYLKWDNPRFWDHLRYLLPHKKQKNKGIDKTKAVLNNYGHPMTRMLESRPNSASVARTEETLENEKNRLKSIAQTNGGAVNSSNGQINEAYVAISTEDISVHCDSFKEANKPKVTSGRHRPSSSDNAVRPPRKKDTRVSEA